MGAIAAKIFFKNGVDKASAFKEVNQKLIEINVVDIDGNEKIIGDYFANKKAIIFVNVACACGLTSNHYTQLQDLYQKYEKEGLEILGFPCNQFKNQESKIESEIKDTCIINLKAMLNCYSKV